MKAECVRDLNRKYLVATDDSYGYQTEMLLRNKSEGFIAVSKKEWDNEIKLYYDITGKQSMEKGFVKRKISYSEISELLYSISCQVKECKRLFLDVSGIVLSPEYIFRDISSEKFYWIYYPGQKDSHEIMELAEFLLEHIDNGNQAVVKTAYELYRRAKEGSIDAENLYEILKSETEIEEMEFEGEKKDYRNETSKVCPQVPKSKLDRTIDRLFNLMKTNNKEKTKDGANSGEKFTEDSDLPKEIADDSNAETVFLSFPEDNTRRLISRDNSVSDANLEFFPCVLGSRQDCVDILLNDRSISRMHAQIDEAQGKLYIYDLNSRNGTFVNGRRIVSEEKEITAGDEIQLGNLRFVLA